jgi:anti-sigma factor RsiW
VKRFTCDELVELITDYLDDALDEPVLDSFEGHLACCAWCGRTLDQYRTTIRTLGELPPERLSDGTRDRLMSAFRERRHV